METDMKRLTFLSSTVLFSIFMLASSATAADLLWQVTTGTSADGEPCWSPDGDTIAFASDRSGNFDIWTIPA